MSEWQTAIWQDVLTIKNGKSQKKVVNPDGEYPIYGSGGIMGYADDYLCEAETTVIGRKGSINKPLYVWEKFWNVDTAFGLCAGEKLDNRFLYYFCITYNFLKHNKATTLPSLTKADLLKIKIPLPPLPEQQKIAAILDAADQLRQKDQQLIEHYTRLGQALFLEMFGDPVGNPMGWEEIDLGEIINVKHGFAFKSEFFSNEGEHVLLTPGNFSSEGGYKSQGAKQKFYSGDFPIDYLLDKNDLLVAMTEQAAGLLSCPLFVPEKGKYLHNQRLGLVEITGSANRRYLFGLFNSSVIRQLIHVKATGTKVRHTSPTKIKEIRVGLPPLALQNQFAQHIEAIEQQKQSAQASLEKSEALFNSLLQRAFKGELTG